MKSKEFLDLNVNVFVNKKNSQWSVSIPKRKLKNYLDTNKDINQNKKEAPKKLSIRLFKWWK